VATLDTRTAPDHQHTAAWLRRARLRGGPLGELALLALLMVAVLVVLERVAIWTLARVQPAIAPDRPDDTPRPRAQVVS
jgi:hypothetical protein